MQMPSCSSRDSVVWIRYGPEAQGSVRPTDKVMLFRMTFREYLNRGGRCRQQELELIFWRLSGEKVILLAGWTRLHGDKSSRSSKEIMRPFLCSALWDPWLFWPGFWSYYLTPQSQTNSRVWLLPLLLTRISSPSEVQARACWDFREPYRPSLAPNNQ